ncbi:hypothetical protein GGR26_000185 [Lewinella marina]|uniref:Uncharacterized protein n=1 Tax=Neolewinella marina TaxID=438751 RepID=A0A2G0CK68_9BACT|nr:hypothetical protein [Neolewinella marina]NJB84440.1 hypothetical protein [Neolewinella marina]PHL00367.1 hypothetical protein CGL56_04855 [Neolewinella marina]
MPTQYANEQTLGSEENIAEYLKQYAWVYAFSQGYRFGSGSEGEIQYMAGQAAAAILNPPADYGGASPAQLTRIAEKQLGIFIDNMIIARGEVYLDGGHGGVIGEDTLAWAKARLCPMWPICK